MSLQKSFKGLGRWLLFCAVFSGATYWYLGSRLLILRYSEHSLKEPVLITINETVPLLSVSERLETGEAGGFRYIEFPQTLGAISVSIQSAMHGRQSCQVTVSSRGCELEIFLTASKLSCGNACSKSF